MPDSKPSKLPPDQSVIQGPVKQGNVLAFDYGLRHIGVAVAQTLTRQARGVTTLSAKQGKVRWREVNVLVEDFKPYCVVVGLPLNMDGTTSELTSLARAFAQQLGRRFDLPAHMQDERLTSVEAQHMMADAKALGLGATDHELAACLIAEQFLNEN